MKTDRELREALLALLDAGDPADFERRVMAAVRAVPHHEPAWWETLGSWAMPGLAAATVIFAVSALALRRPAETAASTLAAELASSEETELLSESVPPNPDLVLAAQIGGSRGR